MNLPTHTQCIELLDEHNVPENVRKHSFCVNKVAVFLAKKLKEKGIDIDVELVDRASLLHDLDKIPTLHTKNHGEITHKILSEKGHDRVGEVAKKHRFREILNDGLKTWEEKIVNYADKRCTEDNIVSLQDRFAYGRKRYSRDIDENTPKAEKLFLELEKEIFRIIGLEPEKLSEYIA